MMELDFTHDPERRSWVLSAQDPETDFPIQNLPFAVFRRQALTDDPWRAGVAIGDQVVCLAALYQMQLLDGLAQQACGIAAQAHLNDFFSLGPVAWRALRHGLSTLLEKGQSVKNQQLMSTALIEQQAVEYRLPARVGDYTDFYTSIDHARNVGLMRRPDNPLNPNFQWMPIAYHGRASTLGVSGQAVRRPQGQIRLDDTGAPELQPCRLLDYELELGVWVGQGNDQGTPVPIGQAIDHIFGLCLLNDWSARDIQFWEMAPLGPFLAKNFATTLSPWIVTLDALLPYRKAWERAADQPKPLAYLDDHSIRSAGAYDIHLQVALQSERMRQAGLAAQVLSTGNFAQQYWSIAQMLTHHTINGCSLQSGDLLGTGTISGASLDQAGSLLELAQGGRNPINLPTGETRAFLADGDTVTLKAWCGGQGKTRIGFGVCAGTVLANE